MTDQNKLDFEERIRRLEARRQVEQEQSYAANPSVKREKRTNPLPLLAVMLVGAVALAVAAAMLKNVDDFVPVPLAKSRPALKPEPEPAPTQIAALYEPFERRREDTGITHATQAVVLPNEAEIALNDVSDTFKIASDTGIPGRIDQIPAATECTTRARQSHELHYSVNVESPRQRAPVNALNTSQVAAYLTDTIRKKDFDGSLPKLERMIDKGRLPVVNLFLTDNRGPLYLVLQSMTSALWNLQTAPGVEIAHVVVIGRATSGVTLPSPDTSLEILRYSDFVREERFGSNDVIRPCMIRPWRAPQPTWQFVEQTETNLLAHNNIHTRTMGHRAYEHWFRSQFNVRTDHNAVDVFSATHILAGPVPTEPIDYLPLQDRAITISAAEHVFTGTKEGRADAIETTLLSVLRDAAGGDLALLTPQPIAAPEVVQ